MKLTEANDATQKALAETQKEKEHTEEALAQSEAVRTFLVEAFRGFDPTRNTRPVTVIDLLDRAAARLDKETIRSRVTKAVLLGALGQTYLGMGHYARAEALLENALALRKSDLGADHPDVLIIRNNLAEAYRLAGRTAEAAALHELTLRLREAKLGADHPYTLASRNNLALAYQTLGRADDAVSVHEFDAQADGSEARRRPPRRPRHP